MDGMQVMFWVFNDESGPDGAGFSTTKTLTFGGVTAAAEIGLTSFEPLMTQVNPIPGTNPQGYYENTHGVFCAFTDCTWVDSTGMVHNDNLGGPGAFSFPTFLGRNGLTSLTVNVEAQNVMGQAVLNVSFWPAGSWSSN